MVPTSPDSPKTDDPQISGLAPGLDPRDVRRMLRLMGELAALRSDPRAWRLELLTELARLLPAAVAAAFILKSNSAPRTVVSIFDIGFKLPEERHAFLHEFNTAPFQDPLSKFLLDQVAAAPPSPCPTITAARSDHFDDAAWRDLSHIQQYRRSAGIDDCIISAHRRPSGESGEAGRDTVMVLCAFRRAGDSQRFSRRERLLLDTLHAGLSWMYRSEETTLRLNRASALSPRLRETLDLLLDGLTERQAALKMNISAHTVHDYVKALYIHFGVSSRGELLARWIQSGGEPPAPHQKS